jgi:putative hydrolase of the HAD superfamily
MYKAVFFDLYFTLIGYDPPQEVIESRILRELGVEVEPEKLRHPLFLANEFIYDEMARFPMNKRTQNERTTLLLRFHELVFEKAGVSYTPQLIMRVLAKGQQSKSRLVLYPDVLPVLGGLKQRGLVLGLISNVEGDILPTLDELQVRPLLDVVVTSRETGFNKPRPEIFFKALEKGDVTPQDTLYVGDQISVDIVGAKNAGIDAVLLDRSGFNRDGKDYRRIRDLTQLEPLLKS